MRVEVPVCKRCCFCLPLRYGLLVWGYFKLLISSLSLIALSFIWKTIHDDQKYLLRRKTAIVYTSIATVLSVTNIALSITFIVGCHQKKVKLLKIFYTYSLITCVIMLIIQVYNLIDIVISIIHLKSNNVANWKIPITVLMMHLSDLMLQIYIIILVRSEIIKLNNSYQFQFTNNAAEAECTLNVNNVDSEEETEHNYMHDVKETKHDEVMKVQVTHH